MAQLVEEHDVLTVTAYQERFAGGAGGRPGLNQWIEKALGADFEDEEALPIYRIPVKVQRSDDVQVNARGVGVKLAERHLMDSLRFAPKSRALTWIVQSGLREPELSLAIEKRDAVAASLLAQQPQVGLKRSPVLGGWVPPKLGTGGGQEERIACSDPCAREPFGPPRCDLADLEVGDGAELTRGPRKQARPASLVDDECDGCERRSDGQEDEGDPLP
jgi:hypothetical protein